MKSILRILWLAWAFVGVWFSSRGGRREPSIAALFRYADAADRLVAMAKQANVQQGLALDTNTLEESVKVSRELALAIAAERAKREDLLSAVFRLR
mgnify:CR=1 FL=1